MNTKYSYDGVQKVYPGAIMFEAQKYWSLSDSQKKKYDIADIVDNGKYFGQLKKDGNWYAFVKGINGEKYLFSRNESVKTKLLTEKIENTPHIANALDVLPNGTVLLGEIYVPGGDSNATRRYMGCLPEEAISRQREEGYVHYYIFDSVAYSGTTYFELGAWERWLKTKEIYEALQLGQHSFLELATTFEDGLYKRAQKYLEDGEEGIVAKKKDSPYTPGKKPAWSSIKIKKEDSADVVCMGFEDPTELYDGKEIETWQYWYNPITKENLPVGEHFNEQSDVCKPITKYYYYGMAGSMIIGAYNLNGELVEIGTVSSGLTDEIRLELAKNPNHYIGKVVKVDMMEKFYDTYKVRQPIFRGFHDDKNSYECTLEEIFQK